jgi:hypothetical protein
VCRFPGFSKVADRQPVIQAPDSTVADLQLFKKPEKYLGMTAPARSAALASRFATSGVAR